MAAPSEDLGQLLERFRRGAEVIAVAATGAAGAELDFVSAPGRWTIRQIACHMADSEMVARDRICRVIAEDNPTLIGYDQDAWATRLDYHKRKISHALESFRRYRGENYELLKEQPPEAFARRGNHSEHGPLTLLDLLRTYAGHAEGHARQIREVRAAYKAAKAQSAAG
jgi:hypothetical protein